MKGNIWRFAMVSLVMFGCGRAKVEPNNIVTVDDGLAERPLDGPPEYLSESEEGFADMVFYVTDFKTSASSISFIARATSKGQPIAFAVEIPSKWGDQSQTVKGTKISVRTGSIRLKSIGSESDRFVGAVASAYESKVVNLKMSKTVEGLGVCLMGNPSNLKTEQCQIKTFLGEPVTETDPYAEIFVNIDFPRHRLKLQEKDIEYRPQIAGFLAGKYKTAYRDPSKEALGAVTTIKGK